MPLSRRRLACLALPALAAGCASPDPALYPIQMKPGEKQFWRVANATLQDFMQLQVRVDGTPESLQLIALDGYPLTQTRNTDTILIPPAGRAEFIVQAPPSGSSGVLYSDVYDTGPTGNLQLPRQKTVDWANYSLRADQQFATSLARKAVDLTKSKNSTALAIYSEALKREGKLDGAIAATQQALDATGEEMERRFYADRL